MSDESIFKEIAEGLDQGNAEVVRELTQKAVESKMPVEQILNEGLVTGMDRVGEKFKKNEIFIPEVLIAARAMKAGMEILKPLLSDAEVQSRGKVIIGTVKGDLHDIGKNIVSMLLEGAGFEVINMGTDVSIEKILDSIQTHKPDVIGLSALLTTTMVYMKEVIQGLKEQGVRDGLKVIIGGAPITQDYSNEIQADGYAPDAASAVDLVKKLLNISA
jgi:5-methyltetrahydrofolate--homocysteine methyltransferase